MPRDDSNEQAKALATQLTPETESLLRDIVLNTLPADIGKDGSMYDYAMLKIQPRGWNEEAFATKLPLLEAHPLVHWVKRASQQSQYLYLVLCKPVGVVKQARNILQNDPRLRKAKATDVPHQAAQATA